MRSACGHSDSAPGSRRPSDGPAGASQQPPPCCVSRFPPDRGKQKRDRAQQKKGATAARTKLWRRTLIALLCYRVKRSIRSCVFLEGDYKGGTFLSSKKRFPPVVSFLKNPGTCSGQRPYTNRTRQPHGQRNTRRTPTQTKAAARTAFVSAVLSIFLIFPVPCSLPRRQWPSAPATARPARVRLPSGRPPRLRAVRPACAPGQCRRSKACASPTLGAPRCGSL